MLAKLALGNVRKSARDYLIYFVTISFSVALLYAFNTIDAHVDMLPHRRRMIQTFDSLMDVLSYVLIVALALLIIYANNYLIRRRSKEFALYQIFGMRRRSVATILTIETFLSSLSALVVGIAFGVLLSQFLVFVTGRIMQETVRNYHFVFQPKAIVMTVVAFGVIFLLTLVLNLVTLRRFQLAELVKRSRANEVSRLQSKWVALGLFVVGVGLIGFAYWRLIHIGYPFDAMLEGDDEKSAIAWTNFAVTTAIVCVGTYVLFYSLGGALLYFARASRKLYWRGLSMFTVREFGSKIRSAALSMGSISIILFLMLSVITPAFGVTSSIRSGLSKSAPYTATFMLDRDEVEVDYDEYALIGPRHNAPISLDEARSVLDEKGIFSDISEDGKGIYSGTFMGEAAHMVLTPAVFIEYLNDENGEPLVEKHGIPTISEYVEASGCDTSQWENRFTAEVLSHQLSSFEVVSISAYNERRAFIGLKSMTVNEGEYAVSSSVTFDSLRDMYASALNSGTEIEVAGQILKPAGGASVAFDDSAASIFMEDFTANNPGILIVSDSLFAELENRDDSYEQIYGAVNFDDDTRDIFALAGELPDNYEYFNEPFIVEEDGDEIEQWSIAATCQDDIAEYAIEFLGLVTYVSIYVGFVLAMISAAMLAIQILSSFSEAAPRYRRLSQLGASRSQENRSIGVQVAWYFLVPLFVAACHAWVAVKEALGFIELMVPVEIGRGALVTATLVVSVYGVYALLSYWSAKSVIASEANLTEQ